MSSSNGAAIALHADSGGILGGTVAADGGAVVAPAEVITVKSDPGGGEVDLLNNHIFVLHSSDAAPAGVGRLRLR